MCAKTQNLSSGLEDYLEAIYVASLNDVQLKGAELARKLNISRASVSEALAKLASKGLEEAKNVYNKHRILKDFFEKVLNIPASEAGENACKIEHIISQNILNEMINFTKFCTNHQEILEMYQKETKK